MAVHATEPGGWDAGTVTANICTVVRMLLSLRAKKVDWLGEQLGISRGTAFSRMNGSAPFLAVEIAHMSRVFGVPVNLFFEPPDRWLPRLDSNQEPAGSTAARLTLVTAA